MRRAIGTGDDPGPTDFVVFRGGAYALDEAGLLHVDLYRFVQVVEELQRRKNRGEPLDRLELLLMEAFCLYRGDLFAEDPDDDLFEEQRTALRKNYVEVAGDLARLYAAWGQADRAAQTLRRALTVAGPCEDLHRQLIEILLHAGRTAEARSEYARCLRCLREEFSATPSAATLALADRLG
jgi:DNA-binding SARP family transcriptional activator